VDPRGRAFVLRFPILLAILLTKALSRQDS